MAPAIRAVRFGRAGLRTAHTGSSQSERSTGILPVNHGRDAHATILSGS